MKEFLVIKNYKVMSPVVDASLKTRTRQDSMLICANCATEENTVLPNLSK